MPRGAQDLGVPLQSHRSEIFFSVFEAGRGNYLFLNTNVRQNDQCAVLIEEKVNQLPLSFTVFSFLPRGREEKKNESACVSF